MMNAMSRPVDGTGTAASGEDSLGAPGGDQRDRRRSLRVAVLWVAASFFAAIGAMPNLWGLFAFATALGAAGFVRRVPSVTTYGSLFGTALAAGLCAAFVPWAGPSGLAASAVLAVCCVRAATSRRFVPVVVVLALGIAAGIVVIVGGSPTLTASWSVVTSTRSGRVTLVLVSVTCVVLFGRVVTSGRLRTSTADAVQRGLVWTLVVTTVIALLWASPFVLAVPASPLVYLVTVAGLVLATRVSGTAASDAAALAVWWWATGTALAVLLIAKAVAEVTAPAIDNRTAALVVAGFLSLHHIRSRAKVQVNADLPFSGHEVRRPV